MPEKIIITGITRTPKTSKKSNKPYTSLVINTKEYGPVSGFGNKANEHWQVGDTVELIIKPNGQYTNFDMPQPSNKQNDSQVVAVLEKISNQLAIIVTHISGGKPTGGLMAAPKPHAPTINRGYAYPNSGTEGEINPEEIPF